MYFNEILAVTYCLNILIRNYILSIPSLKLVAIKIKHATNLT